MLNVPSELALTESRTMRAATLDRTDVLDKVKALLMLPDRMHVTTEMVANYYDVSIDAIKKLVERNRRELADNGYAVLRGADLKGFEGDNPSLSNRRALALFTKRTVLNVGQLLTGSETAKAVRTELLNEKETAQPASGELGIALRLVSALEQVQALTVSNADLALRLADLQPKAEGYDDLIAAEGLFDMNTAAKILAPVTGKLGRTRFLNLLRGMKVIIQDSTLPYQHLVDRGYFAVRTDVVNGKARPSTVVTAKGLRWLQAELREEHPTLARVQQPQQLPSSVVRLPRQLRGGEAS